MTAAAVAAVLAAASARARAADPWVVYEGKKDPGKGKHIVFMTGDAKPGAMGVVLKGMNPTDPPNDKKPLLPIAWTKSYTSASGKAARVFATTLGHAGDLRSEGVRRLLANGCYRALGMEDKIPPGRRSTSWGPTTRFRSATSRTGRA